MSKRTTVRLLAAAIGFFGLISAPYADDKCGPTLALSLASQEEIISVRNKAHQLQGDLQGVVIGQQKFINRLLIGLLTNSHVLVESTPGLAKTKAATLLASGVSVDYSRIQFTPDLMPSDITGFEQFDHQTQSRTFHPGPLFNNIILADEINRGSTRIQAALLEAMQEKAVTIGGNTRALDSVFMVIATMNPQNKDEGTAHLPTAQIDRFMFTLSLDQPSYDDELLIVAQNRIERTRDNNKLKSRLTKQDLMIARGDIQNVVTSDSVTNYLVRIKRATHEPNVYAPGMKSASLLTEGAGPRASLSLDQASKAHAWLEGRTEVTYQDVREVAPDVLRGRIKLKKESISKDIGIEDVISDLLNHVPEEI